LNTFASGSLDKLVKVFNITSGSDKANYSLEGHTAGINCIDYFKGDKPYMASGDDIGEVKVWDY